MRCRSCLSSGWFARRERCTKSSSARIRSVESLAVDERAPGHSASSLSGVGLAGRRLSASGGPIVRERGAEEGDGAWVDAALHRHAAMIRGVRRDFERLRPRRTALRRQSDGAELDVDAVVTAYADRRSGGVSDDHFYIDTRPFRRDLAIALLVDTSASTDGWVAGDCRIIDVEKEALLIVGEALAALGDPHAIMSFSSEGAARVEIRLVKRFDERAGPVEVRRRIAGLEPAGYTRSGAAIRHATVGLMRQAARHRLLLLLSDGRPNDEDQYEGRYGIEDTRVAAAEARLQGVCLFLPDRGPGGPALCGPDFWWGLRGAPPHRASTDGSDAPAPRPGARLTGRLRSAYPTGACQRPREP